jgi:hypothetical protein
MNKECRKCHTIQPLSNFAKATTNKDGLQRNCRDCVKKSCKAYYRKIVTGTGEEKIVYRGNILEREVKGAMESIRLNPVPWNETLELHKQYKTGPYSESYKPELLKWALQQCHEAHSIIHKGAKKKVGQGLGTGKLQRAEEEKLLLQQLENI